MPNDVFVPMTEEHLDAAAALFADGYRRERKDSPSLPRRAMDDPGWIRQELQACLANPGVVALRGGQMLGYMITGHLFAWKGQQVALVPEYGHSAVKARKPDTYQRMYMRLAQEWVDTGHHLHVIGYLVHDRKVKKTLWELGFGAIVTERLRDLSDVHRPEDVTIVEEPDASRLVDIQLEHNGYYFRSPIFITKTTDPQVARADLEEHARQGDVFFVYYERDEPCAYVIAGTSTVDGEGFLLQHTNSAQIKSAYVREDVRRKGIGTALLQHAIVWAREHGYERLFVEHETANYYGGNFWRKYFTPYLVYAMRYVDNRI